jgi:deoxyribodipyrimidine photo-lyase
MEFPRTRILKSLPINNGPVIYWLSRDQRLRDNWALLYAQQAAITLKAPLVVCFCLAPTYLQANLRHYDFLLSGLTQLEADLREYNISFTILRGKPEDKLRELAKTLKASLIFSDFNPLKPNQEWKEKILGLLDCSLYETDTHNIVPCWSASVKEEYGAYTLRPRINKLLGNYCNAIPSLEKHPFALKLQLAPHPEQRELLRELAPDNSVPAVNWLKSGEKAAWEVFHDFLNLKLRFYQHKSNDPNADVLSNLSVYLHYGQISAQKIAFILRQEASDENTAAFLEQLIIRKELSDNFCFYNKDYDNFNAFPQWAKETLDQRRSDGRSPIYELTNLENAMTHDPIWNQAQKQMVIRGKMHGYLRMYWAKKILEWSFSPETALKNAILLNDKYSLDGRDPNGYAGIAWAIGGKHDRAWSKRPVFGSIRYMNASGCRRKFDVPLFLNQTFQP